ncbi:LuxR family transcriptional regulator [Streptomyces sp. NBC_01618]|uniref:LuxR family transcriptional regulator n=1 Tax=Streptomyces sp. NBC_01618 TaxID=2975900 RepID=UPI00386EECC0|nr:LuxR family transcriptional regulator [Streptomyces sp. NBC_01618]
MPARHVPAVLSFADNHEEADSELMRRGVTVRSVVERAWLEHPETATLMAACVAQGQHISVTDRLPIKLIIVDRRIALLPLDPERETEPVALVVHRTSLLTALGSLFEEHFEKGWRLSVSGVADKDESPVAAVDRETVALLHVGLTDAAIARQLGMGHRTVQRRLHGLMDEVGAATRFQLGWYAARAGWLDDETVNSVPPQVVPGHTARAPCRGTRARHRPEAGAPGPPGCPCAPAGQRSHTGSHKGRAHRRAPGAS